MASCKWQDQEIYSFRRIVLLQNWNRELGMMIVIDSILLLWWIAG